MGQDRCGVARLVDTHRPGAFTMAPFTPPSTALAAPRRRGVAPRPLHSVNSRPLADVSRALRRLRHPIPARVLIEHGRPVRVVTDRRGWSGGRVLWCAGPWRSSGDWWKTMAESGGAEPPYSWQEWDVALADGAQYRIHEDRLRSQWFIHAVLD
jgi:hypothetical protein